MKKTLPFPDRRATPRFEVNPKLFVIIVAVALTLFVGGMALVTFVKV